MVTTFFRGSHLAINGPAAGLIAVILAAIASLGHINFVLAAIVVSGALQVVLGLLKLGRLADVFHSSVIHGILAAIGVIILAKQIHYALGTGIESDGVIQSLIDAFQHFDQSNPFVLMISGAGLIFLIWHSQISYKFFHFLPAPMWVLLVSFPFVFYFGFTEVQSLDSKESIPPLGEQWKCATDLQRSVQAGRSQRVQSLDFIFNAVEGDFGEMSMRI